MSRRHPSGWRLLTAMVLWAGSAFPAYAADGATGLDLTMEVLGKDERLDDRLVNRIEIPGVAPVLKGVLGSEQQRAAAAREWEERREARRERREQAWERYRERRDGAK